jgi:predicted negative regulator of RcsB-dependent stress response
MARRRPLKRGPQDPEELMGAARQTLDYLWPYLKWLIAAGAVLVVVLLAWTSYAYLQSSREARAQAALDKARPILSQPGEAESAIAALNPIIKDYPATHAALMARLFKADLLYQTRKYAEAAREYEAVQAALGSSDPYAWGPFVTESLSYCYEAQGEYAKAAQTLKPIADQASGSYESLVLSHLALLYDKAGNHKAASDIWERLTTLTQSPALKSYWKEKLAADRSAPAPVKN